MNIYVVIPTMLSRDERDSSCPHGAESCVHSGKSNERRRQGGTFSGARGI